MFPQPDGKADPLEGGVIGVLDHGVVIQRRQDIIRDHIAAGQIIHMNGPVINTDPKEQDVKLIILRIPVHA